MITCKIYKKKYEQRPINCFKNVKIVSWNFYYYIKVQNMSSNSFCPWFPMTDIYKKNVMQICYNSISRLKLL